MGSWVSPAQPHSPPYVQNVAAKKSGKMDYVILVVTIASLFKDSYVETADTASLNLK
jgi:hypothetical protein